MHHEGRVAIGDSFVDGSETATKFEFLARAFGCLTPVRTIVSVAGTTNHAIMPSLRTYLAIAALALAGFGPSRAAAQDPVTTHSPPPLVERCSGGTLTVSVGGESVGEEQYEVRCAQDGSLFARGTTRIALGGLTADYIV